MLDYSILGIALLCSLIFLGRTWYKVIKQFFKFKVSDQKSLCGSCKGCVGSCKQLKYGKKHKDSCH